MLSEERARAYLKCPKYFSQGGKVSFSESLEALQWYYERLVMDYTLGDEEDFNLVNKRVYEDFKSTFKLKEVDTLGIRTVSLVTDLLRTLPWHRYSPIMGRDGLYLLLDDYQLELRFSAVFFEKDTKTTTFVSFSPYDSLHNVLNDPLNIVKLKKIGNYSFLKQNAFLDVYFLTSRKQLEFIRIDKNDVTDKIYNYSLSQLMPIGSKKSPIADCQYKCPFKQECNPGFRYEHFKIQ